ncbi:hypothetical protein L195_g042512 [Trifolium pratense]|uniref:Uncharacterized protein n=1 Tax=Trifolium pratense TaxID=57577 RepID=A0A2K3M6M5_TRIPR|nr:hypothetical protein L195_g042512 [Trifolium pratense]
MGRLYPFQKYPNKKAQNRWNPYEIADFAAILRISAILQGFYSVLGFYLGSRSLRVSKVTKSMDSRTLIQILLTMIMLPDFTLIPEVGTEKKGGDNEADGSTKDGDNVRYGKNLIYIQG